MATLLELYYARRADSDLRKRIESAILKAAYDVRNEGAEVPNHAARVVWANLVRSDAATLLVSTSQGVIACLENPTIGVAPDDATDNDIQFVINGSVDSMAGEGG